MVHGRWKAEFRNSGYQLSEMSTISHKLTSHVMSLSGSLYLSLSLIKCLKGHKSLGSLFKGEVNPF